MILPLCAVDSEINRCIIGCYTDGVTFCSQLTFCVVVKAFQRLTVLTCDIKGILLSVAATEYLLEPYRESVV